MKGALDMTYHVWTAITQYILYRVRQDALADLKALLPVYRRPVELLAPGLAACLEPVLSRVVKEGVSTQANVALAKETLKVIDEFFKTGWNRRPQDQGASQDQQAVMAQLKWVLQFGGSTGESVDISRAAVNSVEEVLKKAEKVSYSNCVILQRGYGSLHWKDRLLPLSYKEQNEALQASAMLNAQVQSLLQTFVLNRAGSARVGKLNTYMLHRLSTGNGNVFRKKSERQGINTEIVLAVDMSGSMEKDDKALMASKALYAVIYSLRRIPGLRSSVIGFYDDSVLDILRPSDRVTPRMKIKADGGTLCGEALKYAMQKFTNSPDSRKIALMLTDGDSDNVPYFEETILRAKRAGVEFLGIGITDDHITRYLQEEECCVIDDLRQLAPEMFRMLRGKLLGAHGVRARRV